MRKENYRTFGITHYIILYKVEVGKDFSDKRNLNHEEKY